MTYLLRKNSFNRIVFMRIFLMFPILQLLWPFSYCRVNNSCTIELLAYYIIFNSFVLIDAISNLLFITSHFPFVYCNKL